MAKKATRKRTRTVKGLNKKLKTIPFSKKITNEEKLVVIPMIIKRLRHAKRKKQSMTNDHLRNSLLKNNMVKVHYRSFQKLIHYIRVNGLIKNLIAGSHGYYISNSAVEVINYLRVIKSRIKELHDVRKAIESQSIKILKGKK
jgi:hypothetical protein